MPKAKNNGIKRLLRDLKEWKLNSHEFPCINAVPLESDIFEWHCNIAPNDGIYVGFVMHIILHFPKKYPLHPPKVNICNSINHPNVYGTWICLDMIRDYSQGRYRGWTSAYSITSILMQLQSFLFEEGNIDQDYGYSLTCRETYDSVQKLIKTNWNYQCKQCKHTFQHPFPITKTTTKTTTKNKTTTSKNENNGNFLFWDGIYDDLEGYILAFFTISDLLGLSRVAKKFSVLVYNSKIIQKHSLKCWFHRANAIGDENSDKYGLTMLCLGYGIIPHKFENGGLGFRDQIWGTLSHKQLDQISYKIEDYDLLSSIDTTFDLLSIDAFKNYKIHKTIFNDRTFKHFIPLYLNEKHGKLAMKHLQEYILLLYTKDVDKHGKQKISNDLKERNQNWHPMLAIYTVANIMKSLIVSVMQTADSSIGGKISLHYSINILDAFFRYHHLLLGIYFHYKQQLKPIIQSQIYLFLNDKYGNFRNKKCIPDFGLFLMYFTLWENPQKLNWNNIGKNLLSELFTRQIKWVLNKYNYCKNLDESICSREDRINCTFKSSVVSRKLFMFQYFFMKKCCGLGNPNITPKTKFEQYNDNFGFTPNNNLPVILQNFILKIQNQCHNYQTFYNIIELKYPGIKGLSGLLIQCLKTSEQRGYHKPYLYNKQNQNYNNNNNNNNIKKTTKTKSNVLTTNTKAKSFMWGSQNVSVLQARSTKTTRESTMVTPQPTIRKVPINQTQISSQTPIHSQVYQVNTNYEQKEQKQEITSHPTVSKTTPMIQGRVTSPNLSKVNSGVSENSNIPHKSSFIGAHPQMPPQSQMSQMSHISQASQQSLEQSITHQIEQQIQQKGQHGFGLSGSDSKRNIYGNLNNNNGVTNPMTLQSQLHQTLPNKNIQSQLSQQPFAASTSNVGIPNNQNNQNNQAIQQHNVNGKHQQASSMRIPLHHQQSYNAINSSHLHPNIRPHLLDSRSGETHNATFQQYLQQNPHVQLPQMNNHNNQYNQYLAQSNSKMIQKRVVPQPTIRLIPSKNYVSLVSQMNTNYEQKEENKEIVQYRYNQYAAQSMLSQKFVNNQTNSVEINTDTSNGHTIVNNDTNGNVNNVNVDINSNTIYQDNYGSNQEQIIETFIIFGSRVAFDEK